MTPEEQAFWDAVFVGALPLWAEYVKRSPPTERVLIAEFAAMVANEALDERREVQKVSTSA